MKAPIKLIVLHAHGAFNCHIKESICTVWRHSWYLRRASPSLFLKMKPCLVHRSGKTVNMHQGDIKGLTRPLLSSGQGVFCGFSCTNGALHRHDGNVKCTDGTMVWWKEMSTQQHCLLLKSSSDGCLPFTTNLMAYSSHKPTFGDPKHSWD